MRKLLAAFPLLVVIGSGCDDGRRDFAYCDLTYQDCKYGFVCNLVSGMCEPAVVDAGPGPIKPDAKDSMGAVDAIRDEVRLPDAPMIDAALPDAPAVEASGVDAYLPVDLAPPDTRVPDAAGTCSLDSDCVGVAGGAFCVGNRCVACKTSGQCNNDAGVPICSTSNVCVSCAAVSLPDGGAGGCPATAPVCEATSGRCVQCLRNSECTVAGKSFCVQNQCVGCDKVPADASDAGVPDGGASGPCGIAAPICMTYGPSAGQCVQCVTNAECSGTTPICSSNTCVPCTSDGQCTSGPGVCMIHQDGRCASDAESIYVVSASGCITGSGQGTPVSPFCDSQNAIGAITASKRLIVMAGAALYPITSTSASTSGLITIVGQGANPTITPGPFPGIHVTSGSVYVRGLKISGSTGNPGIIVDAAATLTLDRCVVMNNIGGLVVKDGAGFDIANSVFAQNQVSSVGASAFGGVYLGSAGTGLPSRFWFNTVVGNLAQGVVCTTLSQSLDGVLLSGNIGGDQVHCTLAATSISGASDVRDPQLTTTAPYYHLTLASPCKDFVDGTVPHPSDDMDGQSRPRGLKLDCGADEYY